MTTSLVWSTGHEYWCRTFSGWSRETQDHGLRSGRGEGSCIVRNNVLHGGSVPEYGRDDLQRTQDRVTRVKKLVYGLSARFGPEGSLFAVHRLLITNHY